MPGGGGGEPVRQAVRCGACGRFHEYVGHAPDCPAASARARRARGARRRAVVRSFYREVVPYRPKDY